MSEWNHVTSRKRKQTTTSLPRHYPLVSGINNCRAALFNIFYVKFIIDSVRNVPAFSFKFIDGNTSPKRIEPILKTDSKENSQTEFLPQIRHQMGVW